MCLPIINFIERNFVSQGQKGREIQDPFVLVGW